MNPANVPPWGCPWHGLVQAGSLTLPNGASMAYPQPAAPVAVISGSPVSMPDTLGSTYRVAVPGLPDVSRTPDELAADAVAGREWRNEALLSGGRFQLYGKQLDGWIYIDTAGDRWLVTCSTFNESALYPFNAAFNATLVLSRFGDFGAAAETYSYPISLSDWQQTGAVFFSESGGSPSTVTSGRLTVDAIKSDGSAAVVMVHLRRVLAPSVDPMVRWPLGFLEINLSGPGSSATAAITVIRSRAQTLQLVRSFDAPPSWYAGWYNGPPNYNPPPWRVQPIDTPTPPGEGNFNEHGGRRLAIFSGEVSIDIRRLLAVWYSPAGDLIDVAFRVEWAGSLDLPAPAENSPRVSTGNASWTAKIELDGVSAAVVSGAWTATTTETWTMSGGTYSRSSTITIDGTDYVTSGSGDSESFWATLLFDYGFQYSSQGMSDALIPDRIYQATTFSQRLAVVRYSGQVLGLRVRHDSATYAYHPVSTPSGAYGAATSRPQISERLYGSWCPFSHQVKWLETSAVCWV